LRFNQIRPASWQSDLPLKDSRYPWSLWLSPKNLLQNKYHELVRLAYHATKHPSATGLTRRYFFRGVSSCYYYWLSCWPWWHPDLVVSGATELVRAVRSLPSPCYRCKKRAENLFHEFSLSLWHHHWSKKVSRLQEQHAKICYPHEETAHCPDY
jgi:hypothetical protein